MLLTTLFALQRAQTGFDTRNVLAVNVPVDLLRAQAASRSRGFYKEVMRADRASCPASSRSRSAPSVPWRDAGLLRRAVHRRGLRQGQRRRGSARAVPHGVAGILRVARRADHRRPRLQRRRSARRREGRDRQPEPGAAACFRTRTRVNRQLMWTDPVMKFIDVSTGAAADRRRRRRHRRRERRPRTGDDGLSPASSRRSAAGGCSCTRRPIRTRWCRRSRRIIRDLSAEQPVERAATLDDVRAEVLAPNRLNALVFGVFAGVALAIAVVGVAGVLAFSVSARTREFGVRLAIGSAPRHLLTRVLSEGAVIAGGGDRRRRDRRRACWRGSSASYITGRPDSRVRCRWSARRRCWSAAAILASLMPAARASRVDVMQALRSE